MEFGTTKAVADSLVGQVLAGALFFVKVKTKFHFAKTHPAVINKSTRMIFRLIRLVIL